MLLLSRASQPSVLLSFAVRDKQLSCFSMGLYPASIPFHNRDQNPYRICFVFCHCHEPQPSPSGNELTSHSSGTDIPRYTLPFNPTNIPTIFAFKKASCWRALQSHRFPFLTKAYKGLNICSRWKMEKVSSNPTNQQKLVIPLLR